MKVRYFEKRGAIWLDFRDEAGKRHRVPSGCRTQAEAEKVAPRLIVEASNKAMTASLPLKGLAKETVSPTSSLTMRKAYELAMEKHKGWLGSNDPDTIRWMQNKIEAYWGEDTPIHAATYERVLEWRAKLKKSPGKRAGTTMANSTVNHHLSHLTVLQKVAEVQPHGVEFLSVKGNQRMRRVGDEELDRMIDWLRTKHASLMADPKVKKWKGLDRMPEFIELALLTTARRDELSSLTWNDVYLDRGFFVVRRGKNGESREVPLNELAVEVLEGLKQRRKTERVFEDLTYSQVGSIWTKAREALGLKGDSEFILHVATRHEGLSRMSENGTNTAIIQAQSGHESIAALMRYTRPVRSAVQAASSCIRSRRGGTVALHGTDDKVEQKDLQSGA